MASSTLSNFRNVARKIICVGRNYREHAVELNNPVPNKPMFFSKTPNCFLSEGEGKIRHPPTCSDLHYEVELGVVIGTQARNVPKADAMNYIGGYTIALDMTARDIQVFSHETVFLHHFLGCSSKIKYENDFDILDSIEHITENIIALCKKKRYLKH